VAGQHTAEATEARTGDNRYVIEGGRPLSGGVRISGAKNAALPALAAALLTDEDCIIDQVPRIEDVGIMAEVLRSLGVRLEWLGGHRLRVNAAGVHTLVAPSELVVKNRASFLVMGPLLARFGDAASSPPGGDVIGQRPIDVHLSGFATLGAEIATWEDKYRARCPRLRGAFIFMDYPSHIGTENLLMAACLAEGETIIKNASAEPEVADLAEMLRGMGARIGGVGTSTIRVRGVSRLHGVSHRVIPDRIEAGTFAIAAAATGGEVKLCNVRPRHMDSLLWKLREAGADVLEGPSWIRVRGKPLSGVNVQALPYPGFPTDLQAAFGVMLTQAAGASVIHERVYDNRLRYVAELRRMGADIEVRGQTAVISGPTPLRAAEVRALDIRSGAALVLAGLAASGRTTIRDIHHVARGYESIEEKLNRLGASIRREAGRREGDDARRSDRH